MQIFNENKLGKRAEYKICVEFMFFFNLTPVASENLSAKTQKKIHNKNKQYSKYKAGTSVATQQQMLLTKYTLKKIILVERGSALKSESIYQENCLSSLGG